MRWSAKTIKTLVIVGVAAAVALILVGFATSPPSYLRTTVVGVETPQPESLPPNGEHEDLSAEPPIETVPPDYEDPADYFDQDYDYTDLNEFYGVPEVYAPEESSMVEEMPTGEGDGDGNTTEIDDDPFGFGDNCNISQNLGGFLRAGLFGEDACDAPDEEGGGGEGDGDGGMALPVGPPVVDPNEKWYCINTWRAGYPLTSGWNSGGHDGVLGKPRCTRGPLCRGGWNRSEAKSVCRADLPTMTYVEMSETLPPSDQHYLAVFSAFPGTPAHPNGYDTRDACRTACTTAVRNYLTQTYYPSVHNQLLTWLRQGRLSWAGYQFNRWQFNFFYPGLYWSMSRGI